ncbi:hypothetical protein C8R47DRAFT_1082910 [Mycena vitilis]|nr:hypothetical protein C8R47DRAFT_1082910 [Mycena vitilis]
MAYLPTWSTYTIPSRADDIFLQQSFMQKLAAELAYVDRQRRNILVEDLDPSLRRQKLSLLSQQDLPESDSSDSESDDEFTPRVSRYSTEYRPYQLRPPAPRRPLADITPMFELFTPAHLDALGFRKIKWDQPQVFADLHDRIGAVFIGPPVQRARWDKTITEASRIMRIASAHLDRAMLDDDSICSGITYDAGLKRPRSLDRRHNLTNMVVLAALRYSPAIQEITSFQNAAVQGFAPRLWNETREVIDAVTANDCSLHLPMHQTNEGPYQPTAFSEIQYRFSVPDSVPRRELNDEPFAFRAVTAVGQYGVSEGQLTLWNERVIVEFPPGSTFVFPATLVRYSFTTVEKPGWQMLITQSCAVGLRNHVASGFEERYQRERQFASKSKAKAHRMAIAEAGVGLYSTVAELDAMLEG